MTSDRPPIQLEGMEERLLTRFKWGLVAELEKPDTKLAKKILLDKIHRNGLKFPREVVDYIAENATENIRDLEGVINAMLAYSVVYNSDIDLELAQRVVARTVKLARKRILRHTGKGHLLKKPQTIHRTGKASFDVFGPKAHRPVIFQDRFCYRQA